MKRDMDLVRRIALELNEAPANEGLDGLEGVDQWTFATHVIWMAEANLVKADINEYSSDDPPKVFVFRLTWQGCEFVDAVRDDTLWTKAKTNVMRPTASFTFDLLKEWLKTELQQGLPTLRGLSQ